MKQHRTNGMTAMIVRRMEAPAPRPRAQRGAGAEVIPFPMAAVVLEPVMVGEDVMRRKVAVDVALTFRPVEYEAWVQAGERLVRQP